MKRRFRLLPLAIFIICFLLLNEYVLSGVQQIARQENIGWVFWPIILLLLGAVFVALQGIQKWGMGLFFKASTHVFLTVLVSEILFALVLLLADLYRLFIGVISLLRGHYFIIPQRNDYWIFFGLMLFGLSILLFFYGIVRGKYAYRVIKHTLYFKDLPQAFNGFKLTQISDVHAGSFSNSKAVQKGIDLINEQKSDLFVFTGDLVNHKAEEIKPWLGHFSQIKAPFGQFSVLGNHDYGDYIKWESDLAKQENLERLKKYHDELGFRLLLDEHVTLHKDNQQIILAGIENWGLGFGERGDLEKALRDTKPSDFKILLSHDPSHWEVQVKNNPANVQLTLSGHTHGMQFGIEAFGIKWSPVQLRYKHWAGIKEEFGRVLNVNRGFGFIGFSGRIGIWPEITVIELKKGSYT